MATTMEIASWMRNQVAEHGRLARGDAALGIRHIYGAAHLHRSRYGAGAIRAEVLDAFRALTPDQVVWSRRERAWRLRLPDDPRDTRMVA
jgi:hypothetical protein